VAHLMPTLCFRMACAASIVTWSLVASRCGRPRSKYCASTSTYGNINCTHTHRQTCNYFGIFKMQLFKCNSCEKIHFSHSMLVYYLLQIQYNLLHITLCCTATYYYYLPTVKAWTARSTTMLITYNKFNGYFSGVSQVAHYP